MVEAQDRFPCRRSIPRRDSLAVVALLSTILLGADLSAQSNVAAESRYAWTENAGWLNWRDADGGFSGVVIGDTFLSGYIWGENVGWIHVGDGTPTVGSSYSNSDGSDFGVNVDMLGNLTGFAWGENIGWVNFDTSSAGADRAVFDTTAGRFRGYAWGENIGWINLDDPTQFVAIANVFSRGDANLDGVLQISDAIVTLSYLFQGGAPGCLSALDFNDDESISISDATGVLCLLFCGSATPPPGPYPGCGFDPSPGGLTCSAVPTCP